jgi:methylaspartate mutase sigma subunit
MQGGDSMSADIKERATLVTGLIGEDVHIVGIRILEHALRSNGFKVIALGIQVSQEEFVNAAIETKANAILISSLSGHARMLVEGFRDKCIEAGLKEIIIYLGGQLVIGQMKWEEIEKIFKNMGVDRVFPPDTLPEQVIAALNKDLKL